MVVKVQMVQMFFCFFKAFFMCLSGLLFMFFSGEMKDVILLVLLLS